MLLSPAYGCAAYRNGTGQPELDLDHSPEIVAGSASRLVADSASRREWGQGPDSPVFRNIAGAIFALVNRSVFRSEAGGCGPRVAIDSAWDMHIPRRLRSLRLRVR